MTDNSVEVKSRTEDKTQLVALKDISHYIAEKISESN